MPEFNQTPIQQPNLQTNQIKEPQTNLSEYIEQARASGLADDQIKQNLIQRGWRYEDIKRYFM